MNYGGVGLKRKNVLLFSDFGIDDFVAVIFSFFSEEINIVGIVADYGNVSREDAVRNAAYLRELTGKKYSCIQRSCIAFNRRCSGVLPGCSWH